VLIDEHLRCCTQGIPAPVVKPDVVTGGAGALTGNYVLYLRYLDILTGRFGPLSTPSDILSLTAEKRMWQNLPTTSIDSSVTHLQGLVDEGVGVERVAWTRELGVTSVTEEVGSLELGEAAPASFTPMPQGFRNEFYNGMQAIVGNSKFPERVFLSEPGYPENWTGTYLESVGEPIVGLFKHGALLFYGSTERIYRGQGFTANDITAEVERPDAGLLSGDCYAYAFGRVIVATTVNVFIYDGTWSPLMPDLEGTWRAHVKKYPRHFAAAQAFYDPEDNVFLFGPIPWDPLLYREEWINEIRGGSGLGYLVLNCEHLFPELGGGAYRADWGIDRFEHEGITRAVWSVSPGFAGNVVVAVGDPAPSTASLFVVHGFKDGYVREENVEANLDDDGDTAEKEVVIEPVMIRPDVGGKDQTTGQTFQYLWTHIEQPIEIGRNQVTDPQSFILSVRAGQQRCDRSIDETFKEEVFAEAEHLEANLPSTGETERFEELESRNHLLWGCVGRALHVRIVTRRVHPDYFKYYGFGGTHDPGINTRSVLERQGE
jgi:hypothetical protein